MSVSYTHLDVYKRQMLSNQPVIKSPTSMKQFPGTRVVDPNVSLQETGVMKS